MGFPGQIVEGIFLLIRAEPYHSVVFALLMSGLSLAIKVPVQLPASKPQELFIDKLRDIVAFEPGKGRERVC